MSYSTIQQHEPLRVPTGWGSQEKALIGQLDQIFDDIYRRFGRLREEDLGKKLRETIKETADGVTETRTAIEQTSAAIVLSAQAIERLKNGTDAVARLQNSVVLVNADGIAMSGGEIRMKAGAVFAVASGGSVQIDAEDGEGSYINLGDTFSVTRENGIVSGKGSFEALLLKGRSVLTEGQLPYPVVVSASRPSETRCLWLRPSSVSEAACSAEVTGSFNPTFPGERTFSLNCETEDAMPAGSYEYHVTFPLTLLPTSSTPDPREGAFTVSVTAEKSTDAEKSISGSVVVPGMRVWGQEDVDVAISSTVNLFETADPVTISVAIADLTTRNCLVIKLGRIIRMTCRNGSASGGVQPCEVYFIDNVQEE